MQLAHSLISISILTSSIAAWAQTPCPDPGTSLSKCNDTIVQLNTAVGRYSPAAVVTSIVHSEEFLGDGKKVVTITNTNTAFETSLQVGTVANGSTAATAFARTSADLDMTEAFGAADLRTGSLKASIRGTGDYFSKDSTVSASLHDYLYFTAPSYLQNVSVVLQMSVAGTNSLVDTFLGGAVARLTANGTSISRAFRENGPASGTIVQSLSFARGNSDPTQPWEFFIEFSAALQLGAGVFRDFYTTYDLDYSHSAYLSVSTSDGVIFSSRSGQFLTAVPEAPQVLMFLTGLILLTRVVHKNKLRQGETKQRDA